MNYYREILNVALKKSIISKNLGYELFQEIKSNLSKYNDYFNKLDFKIEKYKIPYSDKEIYFVFDLNTELKSDFYLELKNMWLTLRILSLINNENPVRPEEEFNIEKYMSFNNKIEIIDKLKNVDFEHKMDNYQTYLENLRKRLLENEILIKRNNIFVFSDLILLADIYINENFNDLGLDLEIINE